MSKFLFWDIEGYSAGREIELGPRKYVRLFQYAWNDGPVQTTTNYDEMLEIVRSADFIIGHNIISYDLTALFGYESLEPLYMAMDRKVIDTFYLANLLTPAPPRFTMRSGRKAVETTSPVGHAMTWLSLDNLCYQFDLPGKLGDLKELAKKHNPPKTPVKKLEYGLIPLDDPEFLEYAEQDVIAVRALYNHLVKIIRETGYDREYIWREMELMSATVGQIHRNGILVDQEFAKKRIQEQEDRKEELMSWLVKEYDFPTEGKSPWSSAKGKEVTLRVLEDFGFTLENTPEWPLTPTGAPKLGGPDLLTFTEGTEAEEFVRRLGELKGQRSISQLVMDSLHVDGRVHPSITALQASGRWSFTAPSVTTFGDRSEELRQDKQLFTAEEGNVMVGLDYSSADARAMAALSGDLEYAKRFETDEEGNDLHDSHNLTGEAAFGVENYYPEGMEPGKNARPPLRPVAKVVSHSTNYNVGAYKLAIALNLAAKQNNIPVSFWAPEGKHAKPIKKEPGAILTRDLINGFNETFYMLHNFKQDAVREAERNGYIVNPWGRRMKVTEGREFTQAPSMYGQGTTREMMGDAILRLIRKGDYYIRSMRAIIHDELLLEFSGFTVEDDIEVAKECMEVEFNPGTPYGFPINFPTGSGYGRNWLQAGH